MFTQKSRFMALTLILALLLAACNLDFGQAVSPTPNVMGTVIAFATQTGLSVALTQAALPPSETQTPPAPDTPAATLTPTLTFTPEIPMVSVSVDTNCRVGPGKIYDWVGALLVGETTEVTGRTQDNGYYYVRNPDVPGGYCWLWATYATTAGNITALPVFTPPPTPTPAPDFTVSYEYMEGCAGWDPGFKVTNTGGVTFRSSYVRVRDTDTDTTIETSADLFDKRSGCIVASAIPNLKPGENGWVYANSFGYDPAGHKLKATIKLCTQKGLGGACVTKELEFKP